MSCNYTEKISSLIDGELAASEAREAESHLVHCAECQLVRADFLSLRSQIASFETSLQPAVQNRELKKILSRGERRAARGVRWSWSTPAIAFASLLIVGAIIGLIVYKNQQTPPPQTVAVVQTPTPVQAPTSTPTPAPEPEPVTPKPENSPAPTKKPAVRQAKPGEQFASMPAPALAPSPERVRAADAETLTAIHFEKAETLLRAFRNVRLNEPSTAKEVTDERKRAQQLVYQNMILRREADTAGDVQIASLLESLEPILLDIANLPDKPDNTDVRAIRERVERKNIVALLQVNSAALARALDD